jgi:CheY-like chemotaxis protein
VTAKLLLADGSLTIQRVIELTFSGEDIEVVTVADGEQAIVRIPLERPDIVLADIGMPRRSGYEVAAFVRDHPELSHVPVLLLAGAFEPVDEARARQVKSAGVLVKPFEPHQVVARVRALVASARARRLTPNLPATAAVVPEHPPPPIDRPAQDASLSSPPIPAAEPTLPKPEIGVADAGDAATTLDDYFDRLDAAFATLGTSQPPPPRPRPAFADDGGYVADLPTLDGVLDGATPRALSDVPSGASARREHASATQGGSPAAGSGSASADAPNALADLFQLLLDVEQGQGRADWVRVAAGAGRSDVTDELVERVALRVLERLAPGAVRDIVTDVVSPIAERLVREEIDRIRRG